MEGMKNNTARTERAEQKWCLNGSQENQTIKAKFFPMEKKKVSNLFLFSWAFCFVSSFCFFILLILCVFIFNFTVLLFEYIFASVSKEAVEISSTVNCSAQQHRSWGHQQIENATVLNILTPAPRIWATVFKRKACSEEYSFIRKNSYFLSRCNLWQHHFCPQLSGGTFCTQI